MHGVLARSNLDKIQWPSRQGSELKGPFTWKEDDPSAGIILALGSSERGMFSAFSLHVKGCIWPQC